MGLAASFPHAQLQGITLVRVKSRVGVKRMEIYIHIGNI